MKNVVEEFEQRMYSDPITSNRCRLKMPRASTLPERIYHHPDRRVFTLDTRAGMMEPIFDLGETHHRNRSIY